MEKTNAYQIKTTDFYISVLLLIYNDILHIVVEITEFIYKTIIVLKDTLSGISIGRVISFNKVIKTIMDVFKILRLLVIRKNRRRLRKYLAVQIETKAYNFF